MQPIMVNVIHAPDANTFDYLLFPDQNPANQNYVSQQFQQFSQTLTDAGRRFMEGAKTVFQQVCESDSARLARAALRAAKGIFHPNQVVSLETLDGLQGAQPVMQRYIMAQPDIRALYQNNRCDGYSDSYVDIFPGLIGERHYDYRRVTDGMVQEETVGGKDDWFVKTYAEDLLPEDRELAFDEKVCIMNTWSVVKMFVDAAKEDPTNAWGGKLG